MQKYADFVADGDVQSELVLVESEHSAMSATIGAAAAGVRAMTATSACGLALMWELLYVASSVRLPIVMPVVNRAFNAPLNIQCDHSDAMGCRDTGWIQLFSENAQEAYETAIQAVRIGEHPDVLNPVMINHDAFIISHGVESVTVYDDKKVKDYVGEIKPRYTVLDADKPMTWGPMDFSDYYFEHKVAQNDAWKRTDEVIVEVGREFAREFGSKQLGLFDAYHLDDAELAMIVLGSTGGTARPAIDELRKEGIKAGMLVLRSFRPFPAKQIAEALRGKAAVAVLDRSFCYGAPGGPVVQEVRSALYDAKVEMLVANFIYGLGGKPINPSHIKDTMLQLNTYAEKGQVAEPVGYINVRE
jgi:pyruvate ferredoxin oxidoreductase alpha subunit